MITQRGVERLMLVTMLLVGVTIGTARAQEREALPTQHLREEARAGKPVGTLPQDQVLHFDMMLPLRAPDTLDQFLHDLYDPANPSYRRFVTPPEFTARFGPTQASWNELVKFARQSGFTLIGGSRDEMDLRLAGTVRAVEAAFRVKMRVFNHPREARTFYSPDSEPTVDMQAVVWHISGLDNFATPQPRFHPRSHFTARPLTTSGACPGNSYCGSDMRPAYYGGSALTGAGQSIGLVEFYGYESADLETYFSNAGQTNRVPVNAISTDGTSVNCVYANGCDDTEQTLDITQAIGMAPALAQLNVYIGSTDTAILSAMSVPAVGSITGKVDAQLSCSWGWGPADPATDDPLFKKFAAQGQSFFTAAGDSGAYNPSSQYVYPAVDANVTVVGGSDLSTTGPGGAWLGETAWSDGGGGFLASANILLPAWQTAAIAAFNGRSSNAGSTTWRNAPDVAGEANFDFYVCADQQGCTENEYGGTSFATPMWAGYMALVNEQAALNAQSPLGFLNATLYAIGNAAGSGYAAAFHDITSGSNGYSAQVGYDLATGWGSPNGAGLIAALVGTGGPSFSLSAGGAISVAPGGSGSVALTSMASGGFNSSITLVASGQPGGVTVTFSPASITASGSSSIGFQVASTTGVGVYPITVTGTSGSLVQTAVVTLTVAAAPGFSLSASAVSLSLTAGSSGKLTVSSSASGGFTAPIALSVSGQPAGVTAALSSASFIAPGVVTLNMTAASNAAAGSYSLVITGTGGNVTKTLTVTLVIASAPAPTFTISINAPALSVARGKSRTYNVRTVATGSTVPVIVLSLTGLPTGVTAKFSPATINGTGQSTLSLAAAATAKPATTNLTLSGTAGTTTHSSTVNLTVN
jgi:subtilase family serine protease